MNRADNTGDEHGSIQAGPVAAKVVFGKAFRSPPDTAPAREAARQGAGLAWLIFISYGLLMLLSVLELTPQGTAEEEEVAANVTSVVLMIVAATLAVVIGRRQPLWAVLLVAVWAVVEVMGKLIVLTETAAQGGNVLTPIFMAVLMVLFAILSVRGALALRRMPVAAWRGARPPGAAAGPKLRTRCRGAAARSSGSSVP